MDATFYGFSRASHPEEAAWFHTHAAAVRFAKTCHLSPANDPVETCRHPNPADILDTPEMPWFNSEELVISLPASEFVAGGDFDRLARGAGYPSGRAVANALNLWRETLESALDVLRNQVEG
jgi:hypothetical protein